MLFEMIKVFLRTMLIGLSTFIEKAYTSPQVFAVGMIEESYLIRN